LDAEWYDVQRAGIEKEPPLTYSPFANLAALLKDKRLKDEK
jgi:hypothetical protein